MGEHTFCTFIAVCYCSLLLFLLAAGLLPNIPFLLFLFLIKTTARLTARSFYGSLFLRHPKACPDASLPSVGVLPPVYAVGPLSPLRAALCSPNGSLNSAPHYIRQSLGLPDCLNGRHQLSNRTERIVSCYPLRHGCISLFSPALPLSGSSIVAYSVLYPAAGLLFSPCGSRHIPPLLLPAALS